MAAQQDLKGQDREVGLKVRSLGLLKRINQEILRPAGFVLEFIYDPADNPEAIGPYEIKITKLKTKRKKEPGSGN